jgi:putative endonuclease
MMHRNRTGQVAHLAGQAAELQVAQDYVRRGYTLAHLRWRGRRGEIDVILRDGDGLIFVEVKKSRSIARAALRISPPQMTRICNAAEEFIGTEPRGALTDVRFDAALLDDTGRIEIIENAFGQA